MGCNYLIIVIQTSDVRAIALPSAYKINDPYIPIDPKRLWATDFIHGRPETLAYSKGTAESRGFVQSAKCEFGVVWRPAVCGPWSWPGPTATT